MIISLELINKQLFYFKLYAKNPLARREYLLRKQKQNISPIKTSTNFTDIVVSQWLFKMLP